MNRMAAAPSVRSPQIRKRTETTFMDEKLLDRLSDGVTVLDKKGIVLYLNRSAAGQYGLDISQVLGTPIFKQFSDKSSESLFAEILKKCFTGDSPPDGDYSFGLRHGKVWRTHLKFNLSKDPVSGTAVLVLIHQDLSRQKKLEVELKNSEEKLQSLVDFSPDIILNIDDKGSILSFNQEVKLKGIVGKTIYDFTLPSDHSSISQEIQSVFESGKGRLFKVNGIGLDGVVRWYTTRILPVKHDDEVIAVTLNARDSSEIKGAETELKNYTSMLDSVFKAVPGTLLVLNRKLNVVSSNWDGFKEPKKRGPGKYEKCYEMIRNRSEPCRECHAKKVFQSGEELIEEMYCKLSRQFKEIRIFPVKNELGKVRYVVVHIQDYPVGKKSGEQEQMLEMKNKATRYLKAEFLSKINHELKTPMIGILGFSKLGQERYKKLGREKIRSYFKTIQESGEKLQSRLNNLLDISRLETGTEAYNLQPETLSMVTTIVLNELFNLIEERGIKVDFTKPDFNDRVQMDVDKIGKVIRNLVSNAVKFSKPDSSIKISITRKKEQCQFAISDSGRKFPGKELEKLFREPDETTSGNSSIEERGTGLAIAGEIISQHNGRIWVESPASGGLTFKFVLPHAGNDADGDE